VASLDECDRRHARSVLAWAMPDAIARNADRGITSRPRAHEVYAEWSETHADDALLASVERAERMAARDDRAMARELRSIQRDHDRVARLERPLSRRESKSLADVTFSCAAMG
jgi:thiaminase